MMLITNEPEVVLRAKSSGKDQGPEEGRRYSWRDDCLARLEGKEARHEYYARRERRTPYP